MDKKDFKELLAEQTQEIDAKFDAQSKTFDNKFCNQAGSFDAKFNKYTKEIDQKLDRQTKEIDRKLDGQTKELERHQKMLLEEFDSRLTIVAEIQGEHTHTLHDHTQKIDALMEMVSMNTDQLEFIKSMLKRKVDADEYEKLERRVSFLEKKVRVSGI